MVRKNRIFNATLPSIGIGITTTRTRWIAVRGERMRVREKLRERGSPR